MQFKSLMTRALFLLFFMTISTASAGWSDFVQIYRQKNLSLVTDTAGQRAESVLIFLSQRENLKMIASFIRQLGPGVTFYVVKDPDITSQELIQRLDPEVYRQVKINFVDFGSCFTPWVQDYFLRLVDGKNSPIILPTYSSNLVMNECKPFELGIADLLEKNFSDFRALEPIDYSSGKASSQFFNLIRVERLKGEMFQNSQAYSGFFPARHFKHFYGEGGSRIATKNYLFIDRLDLRKTLELLREEFKSESDSDLMKRLESLFQKKIISVGESLASNQYFEYHIDLFMTPIEESDGSTVILLGHPQKSLDLLGESVRQVSQYTAYMWNERMAAANLVEKELQQRGFKVERLPIYYYETDSGLKTVTFNNVVQSHDEKSRPTVFVPDYDLPNLAKNIEILKANAQQTFSAHGLQVRFVEGGEKLVDMNGQLRCSIGILKYR